jgi:tetratricopeptide (TPR) repeat protein
VLTDFQDDIQRIFDKGDFKDLDRLLEELKSHFANNIEYLLEFKLIKSRHNVLTGNYQNALDDSDLVITEATSLQNNKLLIYAYLVKCEALHFLGNYDIFANYINMIESKLQGIPKEGLDSMVQDAKLGQLKGRYHTTQGEYNNALNILSQSKTLYQKLNLKLELATTLNLIAGIYWRMGDSIHSTNNLNQAVEIFKQLGNKKMLSLTLNNIAILNNLVGDYDLAIQIYK